MSVTPAAVTIEVGHSTQLQATVAGHAAAAVTWSSDRSDVAGVNAGGLVQGLTVGSAVITATAVADPALRASATVTVVPAGGGTPGSTPSGEPLSVAAGSMHSVAVDEDGDVWTWGNNGLGQLGVGLMPSLSASPVQVTGLSNIVAVAAGDGHNLALASDGTVWAWGYDSSGQVGPNGTSDPLAPQRTPVSVTGVADAVAIAAAGAQSLALLGDGTVMAWGINVDGELGQGDFTTGSATPVVVAGLSDVVAIAVGGTNAGGHALAVKQDGTVWAWGKNSSGQLGDAGNMNAHNTPYQVPGVTDAVSVAAGSAFSLALLDDGTVVAWGANNVGQLGRGSGSSTPSFDPAPATVAAVADVTQLASGLQHTLALHADGTVSAWGGNGFGQLGRGTTTGFSADAKAVTDLTSAAFVAAGTFHSLAAADGLWAWGSNLNAQLGGSDTGSSRGTAAELWH